jgi:tetratricopeptide (TPR) repeat protein
MNQRALRLFSALLFGVFLYLSQPAHAGTPQWVQVKSPHFSVVTDAGEKKGREVAVRFEQMRAVFGKLFARASVNVSVPLEIVAFRNGKELSQVAPLYHGKPTEIAGLFQGGEDRSFIMLDMSVDNPFNVVFHEYAHQLMDGNLKDEAAPWFDEGFAEYFATITVDGKQARVGKIPDDTYLILRHTGMMKVTDLLSVRHNSQAYNESGDHRDVFYAESAMLVHYLYDHQLVPKLAVYFDLVNNKRIPVEDAIQQTFGMPAAGFEKAFRAYVSDGKYTYQAMPTPADIEVTGYTSAPFAPSDVAVLLADIHVHSPDYHDKAIAEYQEILKTDPQSASALRGLGYAYLQNKDYDKAAEYFQRAVKLNSKDPRVHYYVALLKSRDHGNTFNYTDSRELPLVISELETAISLDPSFADPYSLVAFAYAANHEREKGLASMQKALSLSPRNEWYQFNYAQMLIANQRLDDAEKVLHGLEKTSNQQLAFSVQNSMQTIELMRQHPVHVSAQAEPNENEGDEGSDSHPIKLIPRPGGTSRDTHITITLKPGQKPPKSAEIRGNLASVDCSKTKAITLTVVSDSQTLKLQVPDPRNLMVTGGGTFSCSLANKKVAVNYLDLGDGEGIAMILQFLH